MRTRLTVNGVVVEREVEPRRSLSDFLREDLGLTGTHVGCEHGVCGACTVLVDGWSARACLLLAVQCDGAAVTTIEGLTPPEIVGKVQGETRRIVQLPDIAQRLRELGATPVANPPAQFAEFVRQDTEKWRRLVATAKIQIEQ